MNTILSFMDKLYSDSKTLSIVYVVGAVLLFVFIILLIISLRKNDKKEETKIIEEPKIYDDPKEKKEQEEQKEKEDKSEIIQEPSKEETDIEEKKEQSLEQSIFEKTVIIPLNEIAEPISREENIAQALDNVERQNEETAKENDKRTSEDIKELSKDIPNVDDFVDNVVKKTYEKNEQFSSVFVGNNASTIKLDKVMENLNVDDDVKESIVPEEEKTIDKDVETIKEPKVASVDENIEVPIKTEDVKENQESSKINETNIEATISLDNLKKALEEKQKEVSLKQDDLKAKLDSLKTEQTKSNETMKAEDLLNKLNSMKEK